MSNISLNTSLINKSINEDTCNKTDDKSSNDCGSGTISKKSNKKFSYFASKLNSTSSSSTNHKLRSHDHDDDNGDDDEKEDDGDEHGHDRQQPHRVVARQVGRCRRQLLLRRLKKKLLFRDNSPTLF